jgi:hypothetical protein
MIKKSAIYQRKRPHTARWYNRWVQSPRWFWGFWIAVGVCLAVYAVNAVVGRTHPSTVWGLGYGIAAAVLFVSVFAYALRRRTMRFRPGRTWYYLQGHVYGGALFLLFVLMHTGFRAPHGVLTWWLWLLSLWVVGSGLFGVVLQKWIPMLLNSGLSIEVHYDRIPDLTADLRQRAETLATSCDYAVREFYRKTLAPALAAPQARLIYYFDITGGAEARAEQFEYLRALLPDDEQDKLDTLQAMYKTKLEIDAHYTLQKALRTWLYLHVPVSIVLIVLLALHIFAVVYY